MSNSAQLNLVSIGLCIKLIVSVILITTFISHFQNTSSENILAMDKPVLLADVAVTEELQVAKKLAETSKVLMLGFILPFPKR